MALSLFPGAPQLASQVHSEILSASKVVPLCGFVALGISARRCAVRSKHVSLLLAAPSRRATRECSVCQVCGCLVVSISPSPSIRTCDQFFLFGLGAARTCSKSRARPVPLASSCFCCFVRDAFCPRMLQLIQGPTIVAIIVAFREHR